MSYNPHWIVCNEKSYIIQRNYQRKNRTGNKKYVLYTEVNNSLETMFALLICNIIWQYYKCYHQANEYKFVCIHTHTHTRTLMGLKFQYIILLKYQYHFTTKNNEQAHWYLFVMEETNMGSIYGTF